MSIWKWVSFVCCLTPLVMHLSACTEDETSQADDTWKGVCIDDDGDGYGLQCAPGADCNDADPAIYTGCGKCEPATEGCACTEGAAPVTCTVSREVTGEGSLLCKDGTRYCRDGRWSPCEGIVSFTAPPPSRYEGRSQGLAVEGKLQGLLGDPTVCSSCNPDCYSVEDVLQPGGGDGGADGGVTYGTGGGITLSGSGGEDASTGSDEITPVAPCDPATDSDCDGIPDALDAYPDEPPFESSNATIFMDLPPGTSESNTFELSFYLRTADIYFLIDMTGSMGEERDNLIAALKTGNFLDDPSTTENESTTTECADRDFDGAPDEYLKSAGIAGNLACLIRNSAFGAGWYREVPFSAYDAHGFRYSYPNFEPFEHRLDITESVDALGTALSLFVTRGNQNWAEAGTVALSALASGGPIYMGWNRPGIPARTCANGGIGYPCFRADAMPIVVMITDAPHMNGPVPSTGYLGYDNNFSKTQPVNYDALGLRYMSQGSDAQYYPVSGNETFATAYDVGTIDSSFKTYAGDTRSMSADIHAGNLGTTCTSWPSSAPSATSPGYPDSVFKFTVESTKTLTVSTRGSRFKPTLAVVPAAVAASTVVGASNGSPATAQNLGVLGSQFTVNIQGDTDSSTFDVSDLPRSSVSECLRGLTSSSGAPDAWYSFTVAQDMPNVRFSADGGDFAAVLGLWTAPPTPPVAVETATLGTNDVFYSTAAVLPTGTTTEPGAIDGRSVWLSGGSTATLASDYASTLFSSASSRCSNVSGSSNDAVVDFRVAGTSPRLVRIETTGSSDMYSAAGFNNAVGLFARPSTSGGSLSTALACDLNGAGTQRSLIEQWLSPGTYSAIVRGERRRDNGSYGLLISDADTRPQACHTESQASSFTTSLKAGVTYYLGIRGLSTGTGAGRGPYTINIDSHAASAVCAYDNTTYAAQSGDSSMSLGAAEITQTFPPGEYYAVVKGNSNIVSVPTSDTARGWYQLTLGDPSLATNNLTASLPVWGDATSGVQQQLKEKGIRVINVASTLSCDYCSGGSASANTALVEQSNTISTATGATNADGSGLVFNIYNNGSGMGFAVVNAVNRLARNLAMDVSVRLVPLPDTPSPPFGFVARAVPTAGNSCSGTLDSDGDGIQDTHLQCRPGANPRFEVTFTNPEEPNNVPLNPDPTSNGGYNMRLEMVADGQYVVDTTPVYIIPEESAADPNAFEYDQVGWYTQDVSATCDGTERPRWEALAWNATLPAGTSIDWRACMGDTTTELDACAASSSWQLLAQVLPGGACTSSSECLNGYCASGSCQYPTAPTGTCSSTSDCGTNGVCVVDTCKWIANPISLLPALRTGLNGKSIMRLQVQLTSDETRTASPSVQDFGVTYVCSPGL